MRKMTLDQLDAVLTLSGHALLRGAVIRYGAFRDCKAVVVINQPGYSVPTGPTPFTLAHNNRWMYRGQAKDLTAADVAELSLLIARKSGHQVFWDAMLECENANYVRRRGRH